MKTNILFILFFACILLGSCTDNKDESKNTTEPNTKTDSLSTDTAAYATMQTFLSKSFNHNLFYSSSDSLLKIIAGDLTFPEYRVDTVFDIKEGYQSFIPSDKITVINYFVTPPEKKDFFYQILLRRAVSKDTNEINLVFQDLTKRAFDDYTPNMNYVYSPGLTKTNDYVLKSSHQIIWVTLSCAYSEKYINCTKQFVRQTISYKDITDSITCQCGAQKCEGRQTASR
jgi:hypothetical protein